VPASSSTSSSLPSPHDVVTFWRDAGPARWFRKDETFDREFRDRFLAAHEAAARGELDTWSATAEGALALSILLDQFPRNAFRGTARMFATDAKAREIARRAIAAGFDTEVDKDLQQFFHLPFMHSENLADQDYAVELAERTSPDSRKWAVLHRDIIVRFGRFPHRNSLLGRATTPDEQKFLDEGGFGG
jgi:uncharacterized protein (DUF924 family)